MIVLGFVQCKEFPPELVDPPESIILTVGAVAQGPPFDEDRSVIVFTIIVPKRPYFTSTVTDLNITIPIDLNQVPKNFSQGYKIVGL
jgi:hypothetical protein